MSETGKTVAFNWLVTEAFKAANDEEYALSQAEMVVSAQNIADAYGFDLEQLMFDVAARVHDLMRKGA